MLKLIRPQGCLRDHLPNLLQLGEGLHCRNSWLELVGRLEHLVPLMGINVHSSAIIGIDHQYSYPQQCYRKSL